MIKQLFRYRKLELIFDCQSFKITIPNYKGLTYMAIDGDGHIFVFDHEPLFDKKSKSYLSVKDGSYDLVGYFEGDVSKLENTLIQIKQTSTKYDFGPTPKAKKVAQRKQPVPLIDIALASLKL